MAHPADHTISDTFVPAKVQKEVSEPENVLYELEADAGISPSEFLVEIADGECISDERYGGHNALQSDRHPFSRDRV